MSDCILDAQAELRALCEEIKYLAHKEGINLEGDKSPPKKHHSVPLFDEISPDYSNSSYLSKLQCEYAKSVETIINNCYLEDLQINPNSVIDSFRKQFKNTVQQYVNNPEILSEDDECSTSFDTEETSDKSEVSSDSCNSLTQQENHRHLTSKRPKINRETRSILEKVFKVSQCPSSCERSYIAQKTGLTSYQVRVWFTNKRTRSKNNIAKKINKRKSKKYSSSSARVGN
ncbi:unnamed protein product [Kluyveromyces dobzhanskii CBS 2104]|uniref:WGS project CCBQ000000000 data, contig MAT n=1 Tax=Kluyveromyces dobzhanskii CBS 2104 TaxID=1427455 RepID=A0A0A8L1A4_9SACH|nr:unnamed protein product [Kluyveromyces dobzhanskii CBS 2104]